MSKSKHFHRDDFDDYDFSEEEIKKTQRKIQKIKLREMTRNIKYGYIEDAAHEQTTNGRK